MADPAPVRIEEQADGACILSVRAQPGAKRQGLCGTWNGQLKVALRSPAEKGRANEELLLVLAALLQLRPRELSLVSGEQSREKRVRVPLPAAELRARLRRETAGE